MWANSHIVVQDGSSPVLIGPDREGRIWRWSADTGRDLGPVQLRSRAAATGSVPAMVGLDLQGDSLAAAGYADGSVVVFSTASGDVLAVISAGDVAVIDLCVAPSTAAAGPVLVCATADGMVAAYDIEKGAWTKRRLQLHPPAAQYFAIDVTEIDGHRIVVGVAQAAPDTPTQLRTWDIDDDTVSAGVPSAAITDPLWSVTAGPIDGHIVAIAMGGSSARCTWDLRTRQVIDAGHLDDGHGMAVHHVSIERLHDRDVVLSGGHAGALSFWNLDHSIRQTLELGHSVSGWCAVGPDAVIAGGARGFARIQIAPALLAGQ